MTVRMMRDCVLVSSLLVLSIAFESVAVPPVESDAPTRRFQFTYSMAFKDMPQGQKLRVWIPMPSTSEHQKVRVVTKQVPESVKITHDDAYGNRILYWEGAHRPSETLQFKMVYDVQRREVRGLSRKESQPSADLNRAIKSFYLRPTSKIPLSGKPLELLSGIRVPEDPLARGRVFYDHVDRLLRYDKSTPGYGNGDVLWVCDHRQGNCTDFHSLFIAFARSHDLPARFEIGFPLPPERGAGTIQGYHCWAFFYASGHGWIPVDISEADKNPELKDYYFGNLSENRVTFSMGRDIMLSPPQESGPLNFFVYPHVELDGRAVHFRHIQCQFQYRDTED